MVGASCTAELIQDDPGGLARALGLPIPVIPLELPAYQNKENWGAAETFYQLVRACAGPQAPPPGTPARAARRRRAGRAATCSVPPRSASAIATTCAEITQAARAPRHRRARRRAARRDARRPRAARRGRLQRRALSRDRAPPRRSGCSAASASPSRKTVPIGVGATRDFIAEVAALAGIDRRPPSSLPAPSRLPWYSRSVDFDLPHRQARLHLRRRDARRRRRAHRRARNSASTVVGLGTYSREFARDVREAAKALRRRGADHRRLSRGRGAHRRAAARARARHADGTPHRQAPRHSLRGDLGAGACAGLPGALLAADGLRRRQRASSTPGCIR